MLDHTNRIHMGTDFMRLFIAALLATLLAIPAHAQDWWEAETAHFIIKSRDNEEEVREFAERVERFDRGMRFLQGMPQDHVEQSRANKPIIYRFGDYADMSRMAGAPGSGIAGFFISRAGHSVSFVPVEGRRRISNRARRQAEGNPDEVLFHEYTHYFMLQNVPATYPRWYSEGYAEMVSTMRFYSDGSFHIGDVPQDRAYQVKRMAQSRLNEMLDSDHTLSGRDAIQSYGTGWLLSHYLNFDIEREAKLREYLTALGNGEDSLETARRIFGDLGDLERELFRYKNGDFPGYNVRPDILTAPEVSLRPLEGAEAELIRQEMELWRGVTASQAESVARRLRSAVTEYPDSSYAFMLLAEAEHDSKNYEAAAAAAERAVELDPANQHALLYRGIIATKMAEDNADYYPTARQYLAAARSNDMEDPRPLIAYYDSYFQETDGVGMPEHAIIALEEAYDRAGSDHEYRLKLGRLLVFEERYDEAQVVLRPALFSGHSFEDIDEDEFTPNRLFDAIEEGNRDRALELIDKALGIDEEDEG